MQKTFCDHCEKEIEKDSKNILQKYHLEIVTQSENALGEILNDAMLEQDLCRQCFQRVIEFLDIPN